MTKRIERINLAIKTRDDETAERLLLQEINFREKQILAGKEYGIGLREFERLAIIYRKRKAFLQEIEILERYLRMAKNAGTATGKVGERIRRAKALEAKATGSELPIEFSDRRYAAFDLEISKILPAYTTDLKTHRPLGVSCAAVLEACDDHASVWFSADSAKNPTKCMSKSDLQELVSYLEELTARNVRIVSWNGLGFDFDILGEESGLQERCRRLAMQHIDLMFQTFCVKGFPISLESATEATLGLQKTDGVPAHAVPTLWHEGRHELVIEYLRNDCLLTLKLAHECERRGCLQWITKKGTIGFVDFHGGLRTVTQALTLPSPDTSWMDSPMPRSRFTGWIGTT